MKVHVAVLLLSWNILAGYCQVKNVDAIGITVSEMDRSIEFYTKVLHFKVVSDTEVHGRQFEELKGLFGVRFRKVRLSLGDEHIELTDFLTSQGKPVPSDSRSNDLWFQHIAIVVSNMDSAYAHLRRHQVNHISTGPQTLPKTIPAAAGIQAFYFSDPDGHPLEVIFFPPGKGNAKWQSQRNNLFLGIDHTAIGISSTEASRHFYADLLGLKFGGESFNFGGEQEHLNNVFGASLHISGYRAAGGAGVEFLEYIAPRTGRLYPRDTKADDLIHWETIFIATDIEQLFTSLKSEGVTLISPGIISIPEREYGFQRGFYVRDPDGHAVGIFEK